MKTSEGFQSLLDEVASGGLSRRGFVSGSLAAGLLAACRSVPQGEKAIAAGENQASNGLKDAYDYIVVGAVSGPPASTTSTSAPVLESSPATTEPEAPAPITM